MSTVIRSADDLYARIGQPLGTTDWLEMTQDRIDRFAEATGDHQWIHVDPERAAKGPFGACIAHGFLTMSIAGSYFLERILQVECRMGVNYGTDRVRFPAPVKVGSRIRGHGELVKAEPFDGGVQAVVRVTVEIEGGERPACVVDTINRLYF
ncbi:MAG TPA: MaoC family dehydratase [Burkholderiaceae bacterium]|nr:MaoC family dehydratase [Burkholderiaceae bacterium]